MKKTVKFSVQEIDNSGAVIDADVGDGMTQAEATRLARILGLRRKRTRESWFAVVPYEESKEGE